jgi:hypothetical protein
LEKLHWNNDKEIVIQIMSEEEKSESTNQKKATPPPVFLTVRRWLNGFYEPGVEIAFPQNDNKLWTDVSYFKRFVAKQLGSDHDVLVAKYQMRNDTLHAIDEAVAISPTQGDKKKKKQGPVTILKRYLLQDGDVLVMIDNAEAIANDEKVSKIWMSVEEQHRQELEQKKAKSARKDDDIEQYHRKHETEVPLQIFLDD